MSLFHTLTLGCKLNSFDSAAIEGELASRGFRATADATAADVVVINSCTVTHRADADARKLVRRIRRGNPGCRLLVTGCYAERDAEALRAVGGIDLVFGNVDKPRIGEMLDAVGIARGASPAAADVAGCDGALELPAALHFGERTRAFLRVQDGCRLACSYCIIPTVRGASRSVPASPLVERARKLWDGGYNEIVLTGVNTGDWGRDLEPRSSLTSLLDALLDAAGPRRVRLNSLEPRTVTDGVIERMAADPRLCPHLQIPLQSGSDAILRRMRRNYDSRTYLERVERLRAAVPHAALGADVIVGFPGESDEHFEQSYRLIERSPLDYLHVFSWSARPGTPAAELDGRIPERLIGERNRRLRELSDARWLRFRNRLVGTVRSAIVLEGRRALTDNYVEVQLPPGTAERGSLIDVRIDAAEASRTEARAA